MKKLHWKLRKKLIIGLSNSNFNYFTKIKTFNFLLNFRLGADALIIATLN